MELTHSFIKTAAFDGTGQPVHEIIPKNPGDHWLVAASPIGLDVQIKWTRVASGEHVYIPLVPYIMAPNPASALAYMLQLGLRTSLDVQMPIRQVHLAIGEPVNEVVRDGQQTLWQFQVGLAVRVK